MRKIPTFFFLNKDIHKKLRVIPSENILVAWDFPEEKRVWYDYSLVRKSFQMAYKINQVSELIGRAQATLKEWLDKKIIEHPSGRIYKIHNRLPSTYYWSEDDVLNLRDQIFELAPKNKYGEPYRNFQLISRAELMAKMRGDNSLYIRSESGEFIKVWKAQ